MSKLTNLKDLLTSEIKDLHSAESQLVKALPKMAKASANSELAEAFKEHLEETETHVARLEKIAEMLDISPRGKKCEAMAGLVEEGEELIKTEGEETVKDLALIAAAQRVEHYEISAYGTAKTIAGQLGLDDVVDILAETEEEESAADEKLTGIAEELYSQVA
jgi:ferritin-like metal-binding protein YciE